MLNVGFASTPRIDLMRPFLSDRSPHPLLVLCTTEARVVCETSLMCTSSSTLVRSYIIDLISPCPHQGGGWPINGLINSIGVCHEGGLLVVHVSTHRDQC
jgi:hypothetical protein